ncbi:MAG TPA: endolytic transglycosylase MltG [Conexibacter sp.]|nr:endolytic transglycosylase MltG [Conexibacter sp.]
MFDVASTWTAEHTAVAAPPEPAFEAEPPALEPDEPEPPATASAAPATSEHEVPLGTRRVGRHERLAHMTHRRGPKPPRPPRAAAPGDGPRRGRRIAALVVIAVVVAVGWLLWSIYQPTAGDGGGSVTVTIPRGASTSQIGDLLASKGVIDSAFFFELRAKLSGSGGDLKSGTFTLSEGMSYGAALDKLSHEPPAPPVVKVTIPEGHDRRGVADIARADGLSGNYLAASRAVHGFSLRRYGAPSGATLEGFLFPATYELKRGATVRQLVREQLIAFQQNLGKLDLRYARGKNLTVFDVVTIASMVEREVAVARERPLVAAVIYNRLKQGMPLGIDATLRFALNDWTSPLTVSQLASRNPYNTRNHQGLPPGPIGNPGLASLQAAAHPAHVPYLFYVVKPGTCGQHAFSSTDAQFQRDVQRYDSARAAAGGRSPEKC